QVFLPDNLARFHGEAVHINICADDVNPSLLDYRGCRWARASLGHERPFTVMLLVAKNPEHLAGLFVEAMHTLARGRVGQSDICSRYASFRHQRAGETAAGRVPPTYLQSLARK